MPNNDKKYISTFQQNELEVYFNKHIEPIKSRKIDDIIEKIPFHLVSKTLDLFVKKFVIELTREKRTKKIAHSWTNPCLPLRKLEDIESLFAENGLGHVKPCDAVQELNKHFDSLERDHSPLTLWINKRRALLDFNSHSKKLELPPELEATTIKCRYILNATPHIHAQDDDTLLKIYSKVMADSLHSASLIVNNVLGTGNTGLTANFMVPLSPNSETLKQIKSFHSGHSHFESNFKKASSLWDDDKAGDKMLVVVGETIGSAHLGFWAPYSILQNEWTIPGAPQAFTKEKGAAVMKIDKPPLHQDMKSLEQKWHTFLDDDVVGCMFISLPFIAPSMDGNSKKAAISVLNINVDPQESTLLYRAYHDEWLMLAQKLVAPSLEITHMCYLNILNILSKNQGVSSKQLSLESNSPLWNSYDNFSATNKPIQVN